MSDETAMMAMRRQEMYDPRFAQQRRQQYQLEIAPWVQLYSSLVPEGYTIRKNADGTLEEISNRWSPEQAKQIAMIEGEIAKIGERYGLVEQRGEPK